MNGIRSSSAAVASLTDVLALLNGGFLTPQVGARFPLTNMTAAMELAESSTLLGEVILQP